MPIFYQQDIDEGTKLAVWKIQEEEGFFLQHVPLQREITHPNKRLQHLAGRYLLKSLYPDFPIDLIRVADTRKPYLEDEAYHFSISHCHEYAAAVVSKNKRVGVDIEVPTPKVEKIKHKFLHPEELVSVNGERWDPATDNKDGWVPPDKVTPQSVNPKLTLLWSCKEAVLNGGVMAVWISAK